MKIVDLQIDAIFQHLPYFEFCFSSSKNVSDLKSGGGVDFFGAAHHSATKETHSFSVIFEPCRPTLFFVSRYDEVVDEISLS